LLLLAACQSQQQSDDKHATLTARQLPVAQPTAPSAPADSAAPVAARPEKQTLFPDTLHPVELSVQYWTGPQVDSMRAVLDADSLAIISSVMLWTDRYRVLRADDDYMVLRLFFRPLGQPTRWVELDLNAWLGRHHEVSYLTARAVELNQRPPEELQSVGSRPSRATLHTISTKDSPRRPSRASIRRMSRGRRDI
jgi:hypothetical protein